MKLLLLLMGAVFLFGAVDINKADKNELMGIKGVGENKAELIIEYRQAHKCFKDIQELKEVKGFGEKFLEKNQANLTASECKK
ncbi:helix-hairpin-helix domain-containing protein [bacterium]|nr:helix-hairpin-helix domain-containing protein [bacterium]MBU1993653.1 helix-hairpin-helix domain-containing protein [bacterium]